MEQWATIIHTAGDALYLVAAIITLIAVVRDTKHRDDNPAE